MPTYTVTDPTTGKTVKLTGDSAPTESELNNIFSTINQQPKMGGKPPLSSVAKGIWGIMPQNPNNLLRNLPLATGALGGASPIPGGAMMGTGLGQLARAGINKLSGKPQQGIGQIGEELGSAALSDLVAIPALKKAKYGKEIGKLERRAGVPEPQDIPSLPKPTPGQPVSGGIDETIKAVKNARQQGAGSPVFWKQIKDQVDAFYDSGKDMKLGNLDRSKLAWLNKQVQNGLNASVEGREVPAKALAKSQFFPNMIGNINRSIPTKYKIGGAVGGSVGIPIAVGEIIKKLLGGQQ